MNLPISDRLLACAAYVHQGDRIADVGCDHGYLSIHLLTRGIARSAIASDIRQGPLSSAMRNAEKYGVRERMTFALSDGAKNISRDFDCMICAGMGADTMISILEAAPWLKNTQYRLILQCQSKTPMLRRYLSDNGWHISRESVLRDGRFLYTVMEVLFDPGAPRLTDSQCHISPALLSSGDEALAEYHARIVDGLRLAVAHRQDASQSAILAELENLSL